MSPDAYDRLIALVDAVGAPYRLIDHPPEGRTEIVSAMRGNRLRAAAKCMVVMLKRGKRETRFVLAVVPGDRWEVEPRRIASIRVRIWATLLGGLRGTRTLDEVEWSCAGDFA